MADVKETSHTVNGRDIQESLLLSSTERECEDYYQRIYCEKEGHLGSHVLHSIGSSSH